MHKEAVLFEARRTILAMLRVGIITRPKKELGTVTRSTIDTLNHVFDVVEREDDKIYN